MGQVFQIEVGERERSRRYTKLREIERKGKRETEGRKGGNGKRDVIKRMRGMQGRVGEVCTGVGG